MATKKPAAVEEPIDLEVPTEKTVTIKLPKIRGEEEGKIVWVNERRFLIKRGVAVDVPESVAEILEQEERMLEVLYRYEDRVQR